MPKMAGGWPRLGMILECLDAPWWVVIAGTASAPAAGCASRNGYHGREAALPCEIVNVHGNAHGPPDRGETWTELKRGDVLRPGWRIRTGDDSWMGLDLPAAVNWKNTVASGLDGSEYREQEVATFHLLQSAT